MHRALRDPDTSPYDEDPRGAPGTPSPVDSDANDHFHVQRDVLRGDFDLSRLDGAYPQETERAMRRHLAEVPSAAETRVACPPCHFTRDALQTGRHAQHVALALLHF